MHFTHLHVHTEYSLLDGSNKIKEYVARVKELGMDSAAITDHGVMYGVISFYKTARAAGINPILGCEVYVSPGSRFDREVVRGMNEDRYYHLILLAENNTGYANLVRIVSAGYVDGYYYKPRVDKEILRQYHEGIIATSACLAGEVQRYLVRDQYEKAKETALEYQDIFGKGNYFLELQDHGIPDQQKINPLLVKMSRETGIELVCTNDAHYTYAEDAEPHDALLCLQTGHKLKDEDRMRYEGGQYYVKSPEEMARLFPYAPEALENTWKIAQRCHVELEFGVAKLPHYEVPDGSSSWEYLNRLCREGLSRQYPEVTPELEERLNYELNVIRDMGYVDYFLIVWDYIHYARSQGIAVGPGRGSAAGSMVSYCLGITQLDPLRYQLLFERFLNPERVSMPDIDVDFADERRQEVIDYVIRRYGKENVAQIITFGTMAARGVVRDVGRVMDLPYALCDTIAKMVPQVADITLDKALEMNPELKKLYDSDEQIHRLIDLSRRLEGLPRNTSTHAAGVVICAKKVDEYVPLYRGQDGTLMTQYEKTPLEELGLLKMDFLGLRTLSVIRNASRMASESSGQAIDMDQCTYDDPKVFAYISTGHTEGIFQLESTGMMSFMKELQPRSLEDVIAGISLYRPGPMDFIPQYIRGKNDPASIRYDCPQLEPILEPTYGCIVYQEQVMQIVRDLGGYSMGRSDLVRRAMSKKNTQMILQERQNFVYGNEQEGVSGCISRGIPEEVANRIFDEMVDFGRYAFNKSHAAAYALLTYQTAWLKFYYPVEYMAALMTSVLDNSGKVAQYIQVCRQMKIEVVPPDINQGEQGFTVHDGRIIYALSAIKGIGEPVTDVITRERQQAGAFTDLQNFLDRVTSREVNKKAVENFIKAGALDSLGGSRHQMMMVYERVMDDAARRRKNELSGQMSLFDLMGEEERRAYSVRYPDVPEFEDGQKLAFEKEVLGIYVSGHPLQSDELLWRKTITATSADFMLPEEGGGGPNAADDSRQTVGGLVSKVTLKYTKQNKTMAFVTLEDLVGTVEVLVFPRDYEKYGKLFTQDARVFVSGRVSAEDDKASKLICERVWLFEDTPRDLWIRFDNQAAYEQSSDHLKELLQGDGGSDEVIIYLQDTKQYMRLGRRLGVRITPALTGRLKEAFGEESVRIAPRSQVRRPG